MINEGPVGVQALTDGVIAKGRYGKSGEAMVSGLNARYYEMCRTGNLYCSYVATVATSLAATATIGNMVWNPAGSGVRIYLTKWTSQIVATSATCTGIAIAIGFHSTTPTTTTGSTFSGRLDVQSTVAQTGKGISYSIATVLTAPLTAVVLHHNTAAIATTGEDINSGDLEGSIVLEPGGFATMCALGAAAAASAHTSSLMWVEVPL